MDDPVLLALNMLAGVRKHSPYRLPILDRGLKIRGVITGRRILEVLLNRRGTALRRSEGLSGILREKINLFCDEARHIFHEKTPAYAIAQYMAENSVGNVFVVDENHVFKGVIEEASVLSRMKNKTFNVRVGEVMRKHVYHIDPDSNLLDAANLMMEFRIRRLPVVVEDKVVGIITITDILHYILSEEKHVPIILEKAEPSNILREFVKNIMETRLVKVNPQSDIGVAARKILEGDVSALLVASNENRLEGIISRIDLISGLARIVGVKALISLVD